MTLNPVIHWRGSNFLEINSSRMDREREMELFSEQCHDREAFNQVTIENLKEISSQIQIESSEEEILQLAKAFSKRMPSLSFYKGFLDEWNGSYVGKKEIFEVYRMLFDNRKLLTALMTNEDMAVPVLEIAPFFAKSETLDFLYQNSNPVWRMGFIEHCFNIRKGHFKEALNIMKDPKKFKNYLEARSLCLQSMLIHKVRDIPLLFLSAVCRFCEPESDRFNRRNICDNIDSDFKDFILCAKCLEDKDLKAFVLQCAEWAKEKNKAYKQHGFEVNYLTIKC